MEVVTTKNAVCVCVFVNGYMGVYVLGDCVYVCVSLTWYSGSKGRSRINILNCCNDYSSVPAGFLVYQASRRSWSDL